MTRLQFERVNRRISQDKLALAARVPQPVISLIETGTWNPTPEQLNALSRALGVPGELLLREVMPTDAALTNTN